MRKRRIRRSLHRFPRNPRQDAGSEIRAIESGTGRVQLAELEALARAFGLTLPALLVPPGRTAGERMLLALLEGEG